MPVLTNNQHILPFFGDRMSFIRGLDPLGLQNSSGRTYSMLLPGLNNVTGKIRYYSFYCWLLDEYAKREGSTDPKVQQHFIRKAEYLIALASQFIKKDITNIPGSLYAYNQVQSGKDHYDLESSIYNPDGSTTNTYWQYPLGAMGQYYLGSLMDIGLISRKEIDRNIYGRTSSKEGVISGEDLAQAFDDNITQDKKDLFFRLIQASNATEDLIQSLLPAFNLGEIPIDTMEEMLLRDLLMQQDYPTRLDEEPPKFRHRTIKLLLMFARNQSIPFSDRDFTFYAYQEKGKVTGLMDDCLLGWYYYQLSEFWQYACTSIFCGIMEYLQRSYGPNFVAIPTLLNAATEAILEELESSYDIKTKNGVLQTGLDAAKSYTPSVLYNENKKLTEIKQAASGFVMIWSLYHQDSPNLETLSAYAFPTLGVNNEFNVLNFVSKFPSLANQTLTEHIKAFLRSHILYRHQLVAYRKMGNGSKSTQKFIIEENAIRYLGNFDPAFTGPRIGNLISFLQELHLLDEHLAITQEGEFLINES